MNELRNVEMSKARRKRLDRPMPETGAARYFSLLWTYFWRLLGLSFLLLVFCLPVFTIPAAVCAHNRVCVLYAHNGRCMLWTEFWGEFKSSLFKSIPLGLLFGVGLAIAYYLLSLGLSNGESLVGMVFSALGLTVAGFSLVIGSWCFALVPLLPLKNRDILKNARILAAVEWQRSLLIMLVCGLLLAYLLLLAPYSLILLFQLMSLAQFTISFVVNTAAQKRIIAPFEERQTQSGDSDNTDNNAD